MMKFSFIKKLKFSIPLFTNTTNIFNIHFNKSNFTDKSSKEWLKRHTSDNYVKKSKILDYRSRGAFKLFEINQKYKFIKKGQKILDLGCAPGGWSQVAADVLNSSDTNPDIISVDLKNMKPLTGVHFIEGDFTKETIKDKIMEANNFKKFDLILSDMCPEFTGNKLNDHSKSVALSNDAMEFALKMLKKNGIVLIKTFDGSLHKEFYNELVPFFTKLERVKPKSSRAESSEIFLLCSGFLENQKLYEIKETFEKKMSELETRKKNPSQEDIEKSEELIKKAKYNKLPNEEITKLKDDIKQLFPKLDLSNIKLKKEDVEKFDTEKKIEDEKTKNIYREYLGDDYIYNDPSIPLTQKFEIFNKEMEKLDKQIKEAGEDPELDEQVENFNKIAKYYEERDKEVIKDLEFQEKKMNEIAKKIKEEDDQELLNELDPENNNKLLEKFKRWENHLNNYADNVDIKKMNNEEVNNKLENYLEKMEASYINRAQKLMDKLKNTKENTKEKKEKYQEDIFWDKNTKSDKL